MTDTEKEARLKARLAGQRVLLVHGLLGEVMAALRPVGVDYMVAQRQWLCDLGARAEVVKLPTAAAIADNAATLTAVLRDGPAALVIGHSKGGLEALASLLSLPIPEQHCFGFLALQSPFHGSPIADAVCRAQAVHKLMDGTLQTLKLGTGQGISDLTVATRGPWMAAHAAAITALAGRLPMLSVGTVVEETNSQLLDRVYLPSARWILARGAGPNDGLVPLASTQLPGVRHIALHGGHRSLVAQQGGWDGIAALRRLLVALLDKH